MTDEFYDTSIDWICPNVSNIELWNDPFNYQQGKNFVMVVNSCELAQQIDSENDIVSYADQNGMIQCNGHEVSNA